MLGEWDFERLQKRNDQCLHALWAAVFVGKFSEQIVGGLGAIAFLQIC